MHSKGQGGGWNFFSSWWVETEPVYTCLDNASVTGCHRWDTTGKNAIKLIVKSRMGRYNRVAVGLRSLLVWLQKEKLEAGTLSRVGCEMIVLPPCFLT